MCSVLKELNVKLQGTPLQETLSLRRGVEITEEAELESSHIEVPARIQSVARPIT